MPRRDLYYAMLGSDFDPLLRATIPMALHLGAAGEVSALDRLLGLAVASQAAQERSSAPVIVRSGPRRRPRINVEPLATRCEDERFVWRESDPLAVREAKLRGEEAAIPPAAVAPIGMAVAASQSAVRQCARWPWSGSQPQRELGKAPDVPTLILSGAEDVRTPLEQATMLQQQILGSVLLTVPNVGHAVLTNDRSGCATRAVLAFITGAAVAPCAVAAPPPVDPLPPASLADVAPAPGSGGEPGQVFAAAVLTLRHDVGIPSLYHQQFAFAGTVSGYVFPAPSSEIIHALSYIPGVTLSGRVKYIKGRDRFGAGTLTIDLATKRYGTIVLGPDGSLRGTLDGVAVSLTPAQRTAIDNAGGLGFIAAL